MYKAWHNNVLESSFILNLAILAAVSYQVKVEGGNKQAAVHISVAVVFVTFLGITTYHLVKSVTESRIWRISIRPKFHKIRQTFTRHRNEDVIETPPPPIAPAPRDNHICWTSWTSTWLVTIINNVLKCPQASSYPDLIIILLLAQSNNYKTVMFTL